MRCHSNVRTPPTPTLVSHVCLCAALKRAHWHCLLGSEVVEPGSRLVASRAETCACLLSLEGFATHLQQLHYASRREHQWVAGPALGSQDLHTRLRASSEEATSAAAQKAIIAPSSRQWISCRGAGELGCAHGQAREHVQRPFQRAGAAPGDAELCEYELRQHGCTVHHQLGGESTRPRQIQQHVSLGAQIRGCLPPCCSARCTH